MNIHQNLTRRKLKYLSMITFLHQIFKIYMKHSITSCGISLVSPHINDENIHHIDGNKSNNLDNNLALVTVSGHMRLHRILDELSGKIRERNEKWHVALTNA